MIIDTSRESLLKLIAVEEFFAEPESAVRMISPDGTRIAYLAPHLGRRNIWVRGVDPRWLLYLQGTDVNEDWHLHRVSWKATTGSRRSSTPISTTADVATRAADHATLPEQPPPGSVVCSSGATTAYWTSKRCERTL